MTLFSSGGSGGLTEVVMASKRNGRWLEVGGIPRRCVASALVLHQMIQVQMRLMNEAFPSPSAK
jgi:hypothetical protein